MPHYLFAFTIILLSAVCIFGSIRQYRKNNFHLSASLLVLAALLLRTFVASDQYLHEWDERYHALVAKNMLESFFTPRLYRLALLNYDYHSWSAGFIWLHKQPLPLWCMAISMKLFGVNEFALRLPSVIISGIGVYLTYFIGKKLFNEKIGLLAAFFHAINGLFIEMTGGRIATDHVDVFFFFLVELGVVFAVLDAGKPKVLYTFLTGLCIGLAVLCKWLPAFIVLPVWLILNYDHANWGRLIKGKLVIIAAACLVFLPWQLYIHAKFPLEYANEMQHNYRHLVEVLDGNGGGFFYFFEKLFITLNEFVWVAFAAFGFSLYRKDKPNARVALIVWVVVPFLFFSIAKTKMQGYLLFTYPALLIMLAEFCTWLLSPGEGKNRYRVQCLLFAVIAFLSVRYSIERIKPMQDQSAQLAWANEFRKMDKDVERKKVYVNVKHCIEGMFYTNSIMYGYMPTDAEIADLKRKGYEVIVNTSPDL